MSYCFGCGGSPDELIWHEFGPGVSHWVCANLAYAHPTVGKTACVDKGYKRLRKDGVCLLCGDDLGWPICRECSSTYRYGKQTLDSSDGIIEFTIKRLVAMVARVDVGRYETLGSLPMSVRMLLWPHEDYDYGHDAPMTVVTRLLRSLLSYLSDYAIREYRRGFADGSRALEVLSDGRLTLADFRELPRRKPSGTDLAEVRERAREFLEELFGVDISHSDRSGKDDGDASSGVEG